MRRIHLEAAEDHVERLARENDPVGAVKEMIWNALDADATRVEVIIETSPLGGVDGVEVRDNGFGIPPEACVRAFERIGGSWKKSKRRTLVYKRLMHGSSGQGRLRGYALGRDLRWSTVADGVGGHSRTEITASSATRNDFNISDPVSVQENPGTVFLASGKQSKRLDQLLTDKAFSSITVELALYLTVYNDVEVIYNGKTVDPQASIVRDVKYQFCFDGPAGSVETAEIRIIEWAMKVPRGLHLCDAGGMTVDVTDSAIRAPGFDFTAYVLWRDMREHQGDYLLAEGHDEGMDPLINAARDVMRKHFKDRESERRREVVEQWKATGVYPYSGEPSSEVESLERETFELVATTVHRHFPKPSRHQKATLALLREAVRHQPEQVHRILDEVFKLSADDKADLDRLLNRTSLSNIIKASSDIADRLDFLAALSHMVFEPEVRKVVQERSQLHKILASESWIFGEHFSLLASDRSLDAVLDRHLKELDRDHRNAAPVRREDGSMGIVDLMLSRARREHDRLQHLVVELKAPAAVVGPKEIAQIKSYAQAVADDPQFRDVKTDWDFWLITTKMTAVARMEAMPRDRPPGCIMDYAAEGTVIRVWLRTWSEIIEECKDRLHFFREHFRHDPTVEQALEYLNLKHTSFLPEALKLPAGRTPRAGRL